MKLNPTLPQAPPRTSSEGAATSSGPVETQGLGEVSRVAAVAAGAVPVASASLNTARGAFADLGGGLPPALLGAELGRAEVAIARVAAAGEPADVHVLIDHYASLGRSVASVEAALLSALDALDPRTGGGAADPARPFAAVKAQALDLLREAGRVFAALEPSFGRLVHGGGGWPPRPVEVAPDRGDGRPLFHYENTFKKGRALTDAEREQEYASRVEKFLAAGGSFDDFFPLDEQHLGRLEHRARYDYVMAASGVTRVGTTEGDAKPGHSILAEGGPELTGVLARAAGELWVLRDSAGDLEVLLVANNSGHFKPAFRDLENAVAPLVAAGVPEEKIVLFGGPNNLPAIFAEMEEKLGLDGVVERLPPSPLALLAQWAEKTTTPLATRFPPSGSPTGSPSSGS